MLTLLSEIHFWSTQEDVIVKHTDYGSFKYYSKKDLNDSVSYQSKKKYCEQRGVLWNLPNKRPQKLKDRLKELEDYLVHNKIVCYSWQDTQLQLLLSTGVVVNIAVNSKTGDLISISFDKSLATKLQVNILCDGVILGQQVICICNDGHVLGFGGQWKEGWIVEGGPRRRLNFHGEWLAVWGKAEAEHPQPWSPLGKDYQRANLHLYWIGARGAELLAYKKTDGDPIDVVVSRSCPRSLIVIEQKVTLRGAVSVEVCTFELISGSLKRIAVTSVPLQTQVSCCALSKCEDRLLIGCIDGSVALLDRTRGSTRTVKSLFIPKFACWHPGGAIAMILNERGQFQYLDAALNGVKLQVMGEDCTPSALLDLSGYFSAQFTISTASWGPKDLALALEQGPMVMVAFAERSLGFRSLALRYLRTGKPDKAIRLLLSWEFNEEAFAVLRKVVAHLLSRPLTEEVAKYLQDALGSFHSPAVPLSTEVRNRYGNQVYTLTRRFFHQLVRAGMFETAFLLAVDLGHHDLFMDLHYIAVDIGETEMAAAARAQASALLSRCSSETDSNCSRSSCSQCSDSQCSGIEEANKNDDGKEDENSSENYLTTNFNQAQPTTYRTPLSSSTLPPNLPIPLTPTIEKPRATFVKAPQVPPTFRPQAAPAPFVPPLPNLAALGIPYLNHLSNNGNPNLNSTNNSLQHLRQTPRHAFTPIRPPPAEMLPPPIPPQPMEVLPPPDGNGNGEGNGGPPSPGTGAVRKAQAKVKFSDTVTAFIVPEIKRPVRPPPPPHLTDPRKELADSLPLCHPNEDYLKDFAPVRKREAGDGSAQPKIKVVHFGVV